MKIRTLHIPADLLHVTKLAVNFYVARYFNNRVKNRMESITVAFRKQKGDNLAVAFATPWKPYPTPDLKLPIKFDVEFNKMYEDIPVREYLITLFHELSHVRQYASGDLKIRPGYDIWKGEKFVHGTVNYWDEPWEREALSIELGAYTLFHEKYLELGLKRFKTVYSGRALSDWGNPIAELPLTIPSKSTT